MKLLLVEDHQEIAGVIFDFFELKGHEVDHAGNGEQGVQLATENYYDVIILDVMLPKMDGFTVCNSLRQSGIATPIIMLTAKDQTHDMLTGFEHGADDYVVKPFDLNILEARVDALFRRHSGHVATSALQYEDLNLNTNNQTLCREGTTIKLNHSQTLILKLLIKRAPQLVERKELLDALWPDDEPDGDILRSHIYQLRNLIDKPFSHQYIQTVPKKGYQLTSLNTP